MARRLERFLLRSHRLLMCFSLDFFDICWQLVRQPGVFPLDVAYLDVACLDVAYLDRGTASTSSSSVVTSP